MPRARNIKPGFFDNEDLGVMPFGVSLLFAGLWTLADREGRLEDRPRWIRGKLFAYKSDSDAPVDEWLTMLHSAGFIERYEVDGGRYIQVVNFSKHQNPHKNETPSEIPVHIANVRVITGALHPSSDQGQPSSEPLGLDSLIPRSLDLNLCAESADAAPAEKGKPEEPKSLEKAKVRSITTGTRIPVETLPEDWLSWAMQSYGWTEQKTRGVFLKFSGYWHNQTGARAKKLDWYKTWQTWCQNEDERNRGSPLFRNQPPQKQSEPLSEYRD